MSYFLLMSVHLSERAFSLLSWIFTFKHRFLLGLGVSCLDGLPDRILFAPDVRPGLIFRRLMDVDCT